MRPHVAFFLFSAAAVAMFAATRPATPDKAPPPSAPNPDLDAAAAASAAHGWIELIRDYALNDWQRVALPSGARPDSRSPWRFDHLTGILHCAGVDLPEMLLHRTERGDGIFRVEWRYAGTPAKPSSGVLVRTKPDASAWHEASLAPNALGMLGGARRSASGSTSRFNNGRRRPELMRKPGEWNLVELVCTGPRILLHVNGVATADWRECTVSSGLVGLRADNAPVEFRSIRFKPLP